MAASNNTHGDQDEMQVDMDEMLFGISGTNLPANIDAMEVDLVDENVEVSNDGSTHEDVRASEDSMADDTDMLAQELQADFEEEELVERLAQMQETHSSAAIFHFLAQKREESESEYKKYLQLRKANEISAETYKKCRGRFYRMRVRYYEAIERLEGESQSEHATRTRFVHFDESTTDQAEHGYRDQLFYRRNSPLYEKGKYADTTGRGFLNTSNPPKKTKKKVKHGESTLMSNDNSSEGSQRLQPAPCIANDDDLDALTNEQLRERTQKLQDALTRFYSK